MGQVTPDLWAGGAVELAPSSNTQIRWWWDRRVQTIRAQSAGLTMTIQPATDYPCMPWGRALYIVNPKDATNSFTLRDTPGTWSFSVPVGRICLVARVRNAGAAQWWPLLKVLR